MIEEASAKRAGYLTREAEGGEAPVLLCPQDLASQRGAPKPDFETELGEPIFPEDEEEAWWQTQLSRRAKDEEPVVGDEDGPASDAGDIEEEQPRAEVTDSEPESEAGGDGARRPYIAWPRR